jgi:hypothetical protein
MLMVMALWCQLSRSKSWPFSNAQYLQLLLQIRMLLRPIPIERTITFFSLLRQREDGSIQLF